MPELPDWAVEMTAFRRQRDLFPEDQLRPYWGKAVAWSMDGTRIVASGDTWEALGTELDRLGVSVSTVFHEYIAHPDDIFLGAWGYNDEQWDAPGLIDRDGNARSM
jgi:hypothetical protein